MKSLCELSNDKLIFNHKIYKNESQPSYLMRHMHEGYEILFIKNGNIKYVIEDEEFLLQANDVIFTRPHSYHYMEIPSNAIYERINILLKNNKTFQTICSIIPTQLHVFNCTNNPTVLQIFQKMCHYYSVFDKKTALKLIELLSEELLYNFTLINENNLSIARNCSPLIVSALQYIKENLCSITNINEVSNALFVSKSYFFKSFKEELKISPKQYIINKRLSLAFDMITSGKKPSEVYEECGFTCYNTFYKAFVNYYGCTPSSITTSPPPLFLNNKSDL